MIVLVFLMESRGAVQSRRERSATSTIATPKVHDSYMECR
jgi:hypothetical protein